MEKNKIVVTSYISPDLDGVSAMYGYSEYLNKKSQNVEYYINGFPKKEVDIVSEIFDIKLSIDDKKIQQEDKTVLVDTNNELRGATAIVLKSSGIQNDESK